MPAGVEPTEEVIHIRIKALQVKRKDKARNLVVSLRALYDAEHDYPCVQPLEWLGPMPGLPGQVKLYALILHPHRGEAQGWDLAQAAAGLLETRAGMFLDWACGVRSSGRVWLLIKPWAVDKESGSRRWYCVTRDDLAALRQGLGRKRSSVARRVRLERGRWL